MAFQPKIDRCGIIAATTPSEGSSPYMVRDAVRGGKENSDVYEAPHQCGEVEYDPYGEDAQPTNTYALRGGAHTIPAGAVKLGAVTVVTEKEGNPEGDTPIQAVVKNYGLTTYAHGTQISNPVTTNAAAQLLEDDVMARENFQAFWPLPEHKIESHQCPQDIYGAFTLSGVGCSLASVNDSAQVNIAPDKLVGKIISSDSNTGYISVTGTINRNKKIPNNEPPVITPNPNEVTLYGAGETALKSKWVLIKLAESTENNPETAYPTYEFELRLPLKKVKPTPQAS